PLRKRTGCESARAVGAVAVERAACIDDDHLALADPPAAGLGVRAGAVLAGGDDRLERGAVGAELVEELLHPPGELTLSAADERLGGQSLVGLARDRRCRPDRVQLVLVLFRPQSLDEAVPRDELGLALREKH